MNSNNNKKITSTNLRRIEVQTYKMREKTHTPEKKVWKKVGKKSRMCNRTRKRIGKKNPNTNIEIENNTKKSFKSKQKWNFNWKETKKNWKSNEIKKNLFFLLKRGLLFDPYCFNLKVLLKLLNISEVFFMFWNA